jgi:DNA-directed RNA polymerase II subunit RPB2
MFQPLNRLTQLATLAYLRRINAPVNRLVRMTAPRMIHNTGFGYVCPADTPEGQPVGLLKNLSIMTHISVECDQRPVIKCLEDMEYIPAEQDFDALSKYDF